MTRAANLRLNNKNQFQDCIYALEKSRMRSTPSTRSFPSVEKIQEPPPSPAPQPKPSRTLVSLICYLRQATICLQTEGTVTPMLLVMESTTSSSVGQVTSVLMKSAGLPSLTQWSTRQSSYSPCRKVLACCHGTHEYLACHQDREYSTLY